MKYALITDGIVGNIISLDPKNAKDFPGTVALGDRPVGTGDTYDNGVFLRDGEPMLTEQETVRQVIDSQTALILDLVYKQIMMEWGIN